MKRPPVDQRVRPRKAAVLSQTDARAKVVFKQVAFRIEFGLGMDGLRCLRRRPDVLVFAGTAAVAKVGDESQAAL